MGSGVTDVYDLVCSVCIVIEWAEAVGAIRV